MTKQVYEFDRYVRGQLKAQGIRVEADSLARACQKATELKEQRDVLVMRSAVEPTERYEPAHVDVDGELFYRRVSENRTSAQDE